VQLVLKDIGENGHVREHILLDNLQNNRDVMDETVKKFCGLSIEDCHEGSVIIHLCTRNSTDNAIEMLQIAFVKGDLRKMIIALLKQSGIDDTADIEVTFKTEFKRSRNSTEGLFHLFTTVRYRKIQALANLSHTFIKCRCYLFC